ncbi:hypothetical protein [Pandoravirus japonicus]|uniref:Uncharacterized protein n=1 Tax=Pandoravirus japonicus TaxID=2823154 RepID=A0A811BM28_9VIRU|nr:hypothetical protein [Pandoravirus japonicus]
MAFVLGRANVCHTPHPPLFLFFFRTPFSFFRNSLRCAFFPEREEKQRSRRAIAGRGGARLSRSGLLVRRLSVVSTSKRRLAIAHPLPRRLRKTKRKRQAATARTREK